MVERTSSMKCVEEKFSINTAWIKKGGEHFEIVLEPDPALLFKRTSGQNPDIRECLKSEYVFHDAKRGLFAKEEKMKSLFGTSDPVAVAKIILLEGTIQLTADHRAKIREAKHNDILSRICLYAVDPKTGLAHPRTRIDLAMQEAKVRIDDNKDADEQIARIVRELQPILPIKLEVVTLQIHVPAPYGQKLYSEIARFGNMKKTEWQQDSGLLCNIEIPAGLQGDLMDLLGARTHGAAIVKKIGEQER